ncbi:hypothetical protein D3C72_151150 [compost metagenome]
MDQHFTIEQWKRAEMAMIETISDASGSARIVTEMLRIWGENSSVVIPPPKNCRMSSHQVTSFRIYVY